MRKSKQTIQLYGFNKPKKHIFRITIYFITKATQNLLKIKVKMSTESQTKVCRSDCIYNI